MALDFPASPTLGQQYTAAGITWTFDGVKWATGTGAALVPAMNDNRLINSDMRIDQRWGGGSSTAVSTYTVDRWGYSATVAGRVTWGRNIGPLSGPSGFPYCFGSLSSGAYALLAGDTFYIYQIIEADMISDFAWGTSAAQPVTLSFWAYTNTNAGLYGGSIKNAAGTRSYPFTYSIPAVGVWTKIIVTIPGDTAGTWTLSGNAAALQLLFSYGTGATYSGPAGAWAGAQYNSANGALNIFTGTNNGLWFTGVKLEVGSIATPFNRQSLTKGFADCQRYFQVLGNAVVIAGYASAAGTNIFQPLPLPVAMRAVPTVAYSGISYGNASNLILNGATPNLVVNQLTIAAAGVGYAGAVVSMSAEL